MKSTRFAGVVLILFAALASSPIVQAGDATSSAKRDLRSKDEAVRLSAIEALADRYADGSASRFKNIKECDRIVKSFHSLKP